MNQFFDLKARDFIKGLIIAVVGAFLSAFQSLLVSPDFSFEEISWKLVLKVSLGAGISYIGVNLFSWETPSTEHIIGIPVKK